jgi:hypothetical protein
MNLPPYPESHAHYGPLVAETLTEGWCYGAITRLIHPGRPDGVDSGDGFVVAPDGSYCGLVWWTQCPWEFESIGGPRRDRFWGLFEARFRKPVRAMPDLVENFRSLLPALQDSYRQWRESTVARHPATPREMPPDTGNSA